MQLGTGFWASKTLLSAIELGLFTHLAKGPLDLESLRTALGLHPRGARDFFDTLVALGMLERRDGRYANTPETDLYLDRGKPGYVGGLLEMLNARLYGFWGRLTEALQTGQPQNEAREGGAEFFRALYSEPKRLEGFLSAMTGLSRPLGRAAAQAFPWAEHKSFADVGTAQGGFTVEIARAHPHLDGIGFDLPEVRPIFETYVKSQGLGGRLRFQAGSFFEDELPRVDVIVMGHILHDWDLAQKQTLIAKAHRALPKGGRLVVYEMLIDDERRQNAAGLLMSLNMLIETPGGFDFTGADCEGWMRAAGFRETRAQTLFGPHGMVIGTK
jgi:SAM-dependent methyltransferase